MLGRLLCWLGWHRWGFAEKMEGMTFYGPNYPQGMPGKQWKCRRRRCNRAVIASRRPSGNWRF